MLYLAIKIAKTISHIKKQKKEKRRYTPSIRTRHGSVQFSCLVVSDSLQPHEPQHTRLPCPSPTSGVHPYPCPSCRWCHPTILSSVVPSPPALNLSQHQGLFKWVSSLHHSSIHGIFQARVLEHSINSDKYRKEGWDEAENTRVRAD